jgi:predicted membrane protein
MKKTETYDIRVHDSIVASFWFVFAIITSLILFIFNIDMSTLWLLFIVWIISFFIHGVLALLIINKYPKYEALYADYFLGLHVSLCIVFIVISWIIMIILPIIMLIVEGLLLIEYKKQYKKSKKKNNEMPEKSKPEHRPLPIRQHRLRAAVDASSRKQATRIRSDCGRRAQLGVNSSSSKSND